MPISVRSCLFVSSLALALGCGEAVPDNPTWLADVQEIIVSNCGRCHGPDRPASRPDVPTDLRLDLFESSDPMLRTISSPGIVERIRTRAVDYETSGETQMPPDSYLTNEQKETLARWIDQGAPLGDQP